MFTVMHSFSNGHLMLPGLARVMHRGRHSCKKLLHSGASLPLSSYSWQSCSMTYQPVAFGLLKFGLGEEATVLCCAWQALEDSAPKAATQPWPLPLHAVCLACLCTDTNIWCSAQLEWSDLYNAKEKQGMGKDLWWHVPNFLYAPGLRVCFIQFLCGRDALGIARKTRSVGGREVQCAWCEWHGLPPAMFIAAGTLSSSVFFFWLNNPYWKTYTPLSFPSLNLQWSISIVPWVQWVIMQAIRVPRVWIWWEAAKRKAEGLDLGDIHSCF